jgi:hypothetical protein
MLVDIVLDTNVLVQAHNPEAPHYGFCCELIYEMTNCQTLLCVDEGFNLVEANNRSVIGREYREHLRYGMVGFTLIQYLATSLRVKFVSAHVAQNVAQRINRRVASGPDRVFLRVAFNSQERTLASHDFNDIPEVVRDQLRNRIGLIVLAAEDAAAALR